MKVLIQHNFITGLGDMYTSITQYLDYVNDGYDDKTFFKKA